MTNDFLALLKDSALVSIVTVTELTRAYMTLATATGAFLEMGIVIAAIYLLAGLPFVVLARRLESSLGKRMRTLGDSR
jgi:polar amino acid transport system substrate-binding protein